MRKSTPPAPTPERRNTLLLVAKSAFAAAPHAEMARLAAIMSARNPQDDVRFAFTEQGTPSLREALLDLVTDKVASIAIIPLVLPMEPSFHLWLTKAIRRWRSEDDRPWPAISMARHLAESPLIVDLIDTLAATATPLEIGADPKTLTEGSLVPAQKRRVLLCQGGPCNSAGADALWCHLRNRQERLKLRTAGEGTMTAKSTCLGPCNLAPVLQVFPEGTYYGGVTEAAIDRIIDEHLLGSRIVSDFAYAPTGRKQRLRAPSPPSHIPSNNE